MNVTLHASVWAIYTAPTLSVFQVHSMARNRKRKTDREIVSADQMKAAVLAVLDNGIILDNGISQNSSADSHGVKRTMLRRYVMKCKSSADKDTVTFVPSTTQEKYSVQTKSHC